LRGAPPPSEKKNSNPLDPKNKMRKTEYENKMLRCCKELCGAVAKEQEMSSIDLWDMFEVYVEKEKLYVSKCASRLVEVCRRRLADETTNNSYIQTKILLYNNSGIALILYL
jgi:hypothetical protein